MATKIKKAKTKETKKKIKKESKAYFFRLDDEMNKKILKLKKRENHMTTSETNRYIVNKYFDQNPA